MSDITNTDIVNFLEVLEKDENTKKVASTDILSVDRFISDKNIETGLTKIPNYLIYYNYRLCWTDSHKKKKVNKIVFFRTFNKKFTAYRTGKQRYYLLDKKSFDLSRESILKAKNFQERENEEKKKREVG